MKAAFLFAFCLLPFAFQAQSSPGRVEVLKAVNSLAPHVVGLFREPIGFKQTANGEYYVFDRRAHTVYAVNQAGTTATKLVQIGAEDGRLIEPSAFDVAFNGSFAVADAPNGRERVQIFDAGGVRTGGFLLPGRGASRVVLGTLALSGVATLTFNGKLMLMSHPETGWLFTEYTLTGVPIRSIGQLRKTGQEADRDLHLALNAGMPIADPKGGFYFVFMAGQPMFRKYDASGELVYERVMQGREVDPVVAAIPDRWPRRASRRAAAGGAGGSNRCRRSIWQALGLIRASRIPMFTTRMARRSAPSSSAVRGSSRRQASGSTPTAGCWSPLGVTSSCQGREAPIRLWYNR